ncbi:hypothetical protein [Occultella glacieicola]|uniref:hypothetical protein n=1 Tax=Occultella glacieicola TaxID=2518684 RepID=UPI001F2A4C4C|nr:hypothetical protein [Occultella glacieicola]
MDASVAVVAGSISTVIFAGSVMPMVLKALRTRDLASYSLGNLLLANTGNVVHSLYIYSLPAGPIWFLHGFYLITTGLMLVLYLRHTRGVPGPVATPEKESHLEYDLPRPGPDHPPVAAEPVGALWGVDDRG